MRERLIVNFGKFNIVSPKRKHRIPWRKLPYSAKEYTVMSKIFRANQKGATRSENPENETKRNVSRRRFTAPAAPFGPFHAAKRLV